MTILWKKLTFILKDLLNTASLCTILVQTSLFLTTISFLALTFELHLRMQSWFMYFPKEKRSLEFLLAFKNCHLCFLDGQTISFSFHPKRRRISTLKFLQHKKWAQLFQSRWTNVLRMKGLEKSTQWSILNWC